MIDLGDYIIRESKYRNSDRVVKNKLYQVYCDKCSTKVSYRPKSCKKKQLCRSCSTKERMSSPSNNPMYGKKHKNRESFRKATHNNVNYDDRIIEYTISGNKKIKYRQVCPICKKDVGYRPHSDYYRKCIKCQGNKNRKNIPIQNRIKQSMKASIGNRLRRRLSGKNTKSTFDLLSYSLEDLMLHLESKFQPGMSWDNYGEWHIDHIRPDSSFNYISYNDKEFKDSWSLDNLQPLWAKDNLRKSNKWGRDD